MIKKILTLTKYISYAVVIICGTFILKIYIINKSIRTNSEVIGGADGPTCLYLSSSKHDICIFMIISVIALVFSIYNVIKWIQNKRNRIQ